MSVRIIPRLDIKGSNLVKGIHLEGLRVLGSPEHFAKYYYENGADELLYIDVVASLYQRNSLSHIIEKTVKDIFIPLTVGGGLRNIDDIRVALRSGADKVALNTAALQNPELVRIASEKFGSSTIVISIEAKKIACGVYECYTDNGRIKTGMNAVEWAMRVAELGAGEILVTAIDQEGTGKGYDIELTKTIAEAVAIPVIASGGAGKASHVFDVISKGKADAVSVASIFHYQFLKKHGADQEYLSEGNMNFLKSGVGYSRVEEASPLELKKYLTGLNVPCRHIESLIKA